MVESTINTWPSVLQLEVLVSKFLAIDGLSSSAVATGEVSPLQMERGDAWLRRVSTTQVATHRSSDIKLSEGVENRSNGSAGRPRNSNSI